MPNQLNVDQWVMVRDRHRLNRLKKGKDAHPEKFQELFDKSNHQVKKRLASPIPKINLFCGTRLSRRSEKIKSKAPFKNQPISLNP
ncbi:MAG: hypothetical protein AAB326_14305, partial [Pseudomonadota bacterium]